MNVRSPILAALLLAGGLLTPIASQAQAPIPAQSASLPPAPVSAGEQADAKVVNEILLSPTRTPAQLQALRTVLAHAPASYPMIEARGDHVLVRAVAPEQIATLSLLAGLQAAGAGGKKTVYVDATFNTYPLAALILGSDAVGRRQPDEAIAWLDKGLALQPDNLYLVTEKGTALAMLGRAADALALYDATLALGDRTGDAKSQARLRRGRGWALIELGRLDEAEADYKLSLSLEPGHGGAQRELKYIADHRAGLAKNEPTQLYTAEEAKAAK
jgi:tetratricopeptide (TPR) repeat protein